MRAATAGYVDRQTHRDLGREPDVHVDKDDVVELLRARGEHDKAANVQCALPRHVDTDADAGILHQFDVSVAELADEPRAGSEDDAVDGEART